MNIDIERINEQANEIYNYSNDIVGVCPKCGYCPTCGRVGNPATLYPWQTSSPCLPYTTITYDPNVGSYSGGSIGFNS